MGARRKRRQAVVTFPGCVPHRDAVIDVTLRGRAGPRRAGECPGAARADTQLLPERPIGVAGAKLL